MTRIRQPREASSSVYERTVAGMPEQTKGSDLMEIATGETLTRENLREIGERVNAMAEAAEDPSLRTALQLPAEAAENAARKLESSGPA
jgi:hypothetical protein